MTRRIDYSDPSVIADARRQLAEMYANADRRGRTEIGRKLGYSGKPANIRRSVRRLSRYSLGPGEMDNVNSYFLPYVQKYTDDPYTEYLQRERADSEPWKRVPIYHPLPPYTIRGKAQITAFVMVLEMHDYGGGSYFVTRTAWLNTEAHDSLQAVFADFNRRPGMMFENEKKYVGIEAIAFSVEGIDALLALPQYDSAIRPKEDPDNYGITLHSTQHQWRYVTVDGKRKLIMEDLTPPTATGRPFPKKRRKDQPTRDDMIRYIRRAHPRRVK